MSSHRAAADAPLPVSDGEDWDRYEQQVERKKNALLLLSSNTNNRSMPEFHLLSIDSNQSNMRSIPQRAARPNILNGRRQQSPNPHVVQEEAKYWPKEYQQHDQERPGHSNKYDRGAERSRLSYRGDPRSRDSTFADNQPYYPPPAVRGEPRAPSHLKEDVARASSGYWRSQSTLEKKTMDRTPNRRTVGGYSSSPLSQGADWGSSVEQRKYLEEQRIAVRSNHQSQSVSKKNPYEGCKPIKQSQPRDGRVTSWNDSYSTMQAVPVRNRQSAGDKRRGNSSCPNTSDVSIRHKGSRDSSKESTERKLLKAPTSNPYASKRTKSFIDIKIPPIFIKALTDMDFMQPTQIQAHALPLILNGNRPSVMGHAKAGSGKTAAFGIGMLYWSSSQNNRCEALAICPTRELAIQVHEVVVRLAKFTQHGVFLAIPGCDNRSQITDAIVIGTPGKIYYDVLAGPELRKQQRRRPRTPLINTKHVSLLVIDEADHLLRKQDGLSDIVLKCRQMFLRSIQVLCFSATFDDEAREFVNVVAPDATLVEVQPSKLEQEAGKRIPGGINSLKIKHIMAKCNGERHKYECLSDMFGYFNIGQGLIFVQTTKNANKLSRQLMEEGYQVGIIHGKMPKAMRDAVMQDFRTGKSTHLISSNLLARGIDIPNISVVINYDVPIGKQVDQYGRTSWGPDVDVYVHRAGRTGRFGRNGACITLIHDKDSFEKFSVITKKLEKDYGLKIKQIDAESLETIEEDVNSHLAS